MSIDYIDGFVLRRRPRVARGIELGPASEPQDTSEHVRTLLWHLAPLQVGSVSRCPARWLRIEPLFQD